MCYHGHSEDRPQSEGTKPAHFPSHIFLYGSHEKIYFCGISLPLTNEHWGYFLPAILLSLCFLSSQVPWQWCCIFHYDILHMQFYMKTYYFVPEVFALPTLLFTPAFCPSKAGCGLLPSLLLLMFLVLPLSTAPSFTRIWVLYLWPILHHMT